MVAGKDRNGKYAATARHSKTASAVSHVKAAAAVTSAAILCLPGASADGTAGGGPVPPGVPIDGTDFCMVPGLEYSGRWSIPGNGIFHPTIEACAAACEADAQCTGATWIDFPPPVPEGKKNCWFKAWDPAAAGVPCQPSNALDFDAVIQSTGDCANIVYKPDPSIDCNEEVDIYGANSGALEWLEGGAAGGPVAAAPALPPAEPTDLTAFDALVPPYSATPDVDYGPNQTPAPLTGIADIGAGMTLASAVECAEACTASLMGCNAASWYGDMPADSWPGGDNCYLKAITVPCVVPTDTEVATGVIWLMKQDACDAVIAPTPVPVAAPVPATPMPATPMPAAPTPATPPPIGTIGLAPQPMLRTEVPAPADNLTAPPPTVTTLSPPDTTLGVPPADGTTAERGTAVPVAETDAGATVAGAASAAAALVAAALLLA